MAQPNKNDLQTLDYAYLGAPFVNVEAKSLSTATLDYAYLGAPFVGTAPAPVVGGLNVWVKVAGTWKQANAMYVYQSGAWKQVSTVSTKVSGTWKS